MPKPAGSQPRFQPRDLLKQVMIQHLALAPDGSSIVYSRRTIEDNRYRSRVWRVGYEGGRAEKLTTAAASDSRPRFSPDGRRLLFLSDRSGSSQPWVLPLSGGEPQQAATLEGGVRAAEWAPDGRRIALIAPSGEQRFVVGDKKDPVARRITAMNWRMDGAGMRDQFNSAWVGTVGGRRVRRVTEPTYTHIHKAQAPLLLLQSEQDLRCPAIQSELVFAMLRQRGRTVEMVRYPDESHYLAGIGRPDRRIDPHRADSRMVHYAPGRPPQPCGELSNPP